MEFVKEMNGSLTDNGFGLGEEAELTAQKMNDDVSGIASQCGNWQCNSI